MGALTLSSTRGYDQVRVASPSPSTATFCALNLRLTGLLRCSVQKSNGLRCATFLGLGTQESLQQRVAPFSLKMWHRRVDGGKCQVCFGVHCLLRESFILDTCRPGLPIHLMSPAMWKKTFVAWPQRKVRRLRRQGLESTGLADHNQGRAGNSVNNSAA